MTFGIEDLETGECLTPDLDNDGVTACQGDCNEESALGPETCDGLDNDCDGIVDNLAGEFCDTGQLGICGEGGLECGPMGEVCAPLRNQTNEICNDNEDNDCDGSVDEVECSDVVIGESCEAPFEVTQGGRFTGDLDLFGVDVQAACFDGGDAIFHIPAGALGIDEIFVNANTRGNYGFELGLFCGEPFDCWSSMDGNLSFPAFDENIFLTLRGQGPYDFSVAWRGSNGVCSQPDGDMDGLTLCDYDCDDNDGDVFPGAEELCDGVDNNCDGAVDNLNGEVCDTGLEGVCGQGREICGPSGLECQQVNFGGQELCDDNRDNNCDGFIDEVDCVEGGNLGDPCMVDGDCTHPTLEPICLLGADEGGVCSANNCERGGDSCGPGAFCELETEQGPICTVSCVDNSDCAGEPIGCVGSAALGIPNFCYYDCRLLPDAYCDQFGVSCDQESGFCF